MEKIAIYFPSEEAVVTILKALAPFTREQRDLILAVVTANPHYPSQNYIRGGGNGDSSSAIRFIDRPQQEAPILADPWDEILSRLEGDGPLTFADVFAQLGGASKYATSGDRTRVIDVMRRNGWSLQRDRKVDGKQRRMFVRDRKAAA